MLYHQKGQICEPLVKNKIKVSCWKGMKKSSILFCLKDREKIMCCVSSALWGNQCLCLPILNESILNTCSMPVTGDVTLNRDKTMVFLLWCWKTWEWSKKVILNVICELQKSFFSLLQFWNSNQVKIMSYKVAVVGGG